MTLYDVLLVVIHPHTYIYTSHRIETDCSRYPIPLQTFVSFIFIFCLRRLRHTQTVYQSYCMCEKETCYFFFFFGGFIEIFIQCVLFITDKWTGILKWARRASKHVIQTKTKDRKKNRKKNSYNSLEGWAHKYYCGK